VEKIAKDYNSSVVRTKTAPREVMNKMLDKEINEDLIQQFTMNFDAIASLIKIMDFLKTNKYSLSDLVDMIPEFHINKKQVKCPWSAKGKVIREFIQQNNCESIETIEGVKIYQENGWVLVLPDSEKAMCSIISESSSAEFAEELTNMYVNKVMEISSAEYNKISSN
jgi:mannose-1-phosphate guanylyltransferase/phosphomannomutase